MTPEYKSSALPVELITLVYWFYWPIIYLFPRALQLKMNIIIKKQKLENPGIDPGASRMQIERSTTWANPPCALILFTNLFISWVAISNNPSIMHNRSWANPPCVLILLTNLLLIPSCVAISNEYNYKETQKLENPGIDPGPSRMLIERSTTWANPPWEMILFTNLFLISSWVAICNEYNYKETEIGESGYRSRWLPNTNRALYKLS